MTDSCLGIIVALNNLLPETLLIYGYILFSSQVLES